MLRCLLKLGGFDYRRRKNHDEPIAHETCSAPGWPAGCAAAAPLPLRPTCGRSSPGEATEAATNILPPAKSAVAIYIILLLTPPYLPFGLTSLLLS